MTCDEAREAFSALYDEALSGAPLVTITQHLATCPACRAEWASFRKAMQAVAELGGAAPSPDLAARVRRRLEAPPWWERALRRLFVPLHVKVPLQAAAVLLVAFAGLLLYQRSPALRKATEPSQIVPPPAVREAPPPAAPPTIAGPKQPVETPGPPAEAQTTEAAKGEAPPMAATAPPPPPPPEAEKERGIPAPREEAKEAGKVGAPRETPKATKPPGESRARDADSAPAARKLMQAAPGPAPAREGEIPPAPPGPADRLYSTGMADMSRQSYDRAIDNLRAFIQQNPRDGRVPEARLRLGDAYVAQQRLRDAIAEYEALVRDFPKSPLVPAALYRQAQARLAIGDQAGCTLLRDLLNRYPPSPEAAAAREALSTRCR